MTRKPKWPETDEYFAFEKRVREISEAATVQKEMHDDDFFTEHISSQVHHTNEDEHT